MAGWDCAYQAGLPFPTFCPAMANRSFTMNVRRTSGPEPRPVSGAFRLWGTSAPTGSVAGTAIIRDLVDDLSNLRWARCFITARMPPAKAAP